MLVTNQAGQFEIRILLLRLLFLDRVRQSSSYFLQHIVPEIALSRTICQPDSQAQFVGRSRKLANSDRELFRDLAATLIRHLANIVDLLVDRFLLVAPDNLLLLSKELRAEQDRQCNDSG